MIVSFPIESLAVNVASLSGTILSDNLRPSQAVFSVALVLHDAWPLLFLPSSSGPVANMRNMSRAGTAAATFIIVLFVLTMLDMVRLIHVSGVLCGYVAGIGAALVAVRISRDLLSQLVLQHTTMPSGGVAFDDEDSSAVAAGSAVAAASPPSGSPSSGGGALAFTHNDNGGSSSLALSSPVSSPVPGLIANASMLDPASTNYLQHLALISTYCVYAAMLIADYRPSTVAESGPWFVYCTGSIAVEIVRYYWVMRHRSMNVDTAV